MIDWFFDWQLKIIFVVGVAGLAIIFAFDFRGLQALFLFLISLTLVFGGNKIYAVDDSENWLKFSYLEVIKNIVGGALIFMGWTVFLRGVLALAIASLILKLG